MIKEYKCSTCKTEFEIETHVTKKGNRYFSNQAKCPVCPNIMKTWKDKEDKARWRN